MDESKTSEEWYKELFPQQELVILDPDGWERTNFCHSWNAEKITKDEFARRLSRSTIQTSPDTVLKAFT